MKYISFLLLFLCCSCVAPTFKSVQVNTFEEEKKIAVNVSSIDVVSNVNHFERLPHIENKMPITPENSLKQWIQNRFCALNDFSDIKMQVIIEKAYLTQTDEKMPQWYMFDNVKYTLTYDLKFVFKNSKTVIYTHQIGGYETSSLPKRSSLSAKEEVFEKMLNAMVYKVDEQVRRQLPKKFVNSD